MNALPFAAGFMGLSSTNDESPPSGSLSSFPSLSLLSVSYTRACNCNFRSGGIAGDSTRLRFSLLGEGDTGSPLRRFRAREIAEGNPCDKQEEIDACVGLLGPGDGFVSKVLLDF